MRKSVHVTRRAFLRGAAAALAAPYVITSTALGAADRPAASERLTLGHIGIGNQGRGHFGAMLGNGAVQILAVSDVKQEVRQTCQKAVDDRYAQERESGRYQGCAAYNDFRELMARPDIDAVIIAVPDHWHALVAVAAAKAGKDIYCEKPLSLTVRQARAMVTAARRFGVVFQTGSQQRSSQEFRFACEMVRSGRIGDLKTVNVGIGGPSSEKQFPEEPVPPGLDWDMWLGPAPWAPYNSERCSGDYGGGWRHVRDYSGGPMTDWGAHHFDIAQWALGMDASGPVEIAPPDGRDVKTLTYKYANGIVMYHGGANGVLFTGTKGRVEVNRGYLKTWPDELMQTPTRPDEVNLYKSPGHHQDWLACIKTRRRPICDVEIGCRSVTVCHLGNIASWLGRPLKWDPAREEIVGDPEAARWLDRPMRAPWTLT
ncbi:MAG: Gfo/Idh/MocA family oxidoreductase [Planctomycetes bacterium]|nr:Gfo/Idh/MocA family oxidoreductase [Planctomycetota bacterium]